jgi:hypothetical protein
MLPSLRTVRKADLEGTESYTWPSDQTRARWCGATGIEPVTPTMSM